MWCYIDFMLNSKETIFKTPETQKLWGRIWVFCSEIACMHAAMIYCFLQWKKKYFSKFKRRQKQVKVWGCRLFLCLVMLGLDKGSSDRIAEHSSPVGTIWTIRTSRGGRYTRLWHDISEFWEIFCHITAIDHKIPLNTCLLRSSLRS